MKFLIPILLSVALISCSYRGAGYSEKEKLLFNQIKIGMKKDEVLKILGQPDTISYSIVDSSDYEFTYFSKNKIGWSTLPTVSFDSTNTVTFAIYDEGD